MNDDVPSYVWVLNNDERWESLSFRFSELKDLVTQATIVQSRDVAISERQEEIRRNKTKTETGELERPRNRYPLEDQIDDKNALRIPFIEGIDPHEILRIRAEAVRLIPLIEDALVRREEAVGFTTAWGHFCSLAGAIEFIYQLKPHPGGTTAGDAGGSAVSVNANKRWYAKNLIRVLNGRGSRKQADKRIASLVNAIVDGNIDVDTVRFPVPWFERMLRLSDVDKDSGVYATLQTTYTDMTIEEVNRLAQSRDDDLPPTDFQFPVT